MANVLSLAKNAQRLQRSLKSLEKRKNKVVKQLDLIHGKLSHALFSTGRSARSAVNRVSLRVARATAPKRGRPKGKRAAKRQKILPIVLPFLKGKKGQAVHVKDILRHARTKGYKGTLNSIQATLAAKAKAGKLIVKKAPAKYAAV